jgi:hypothetical protein
LHALFSETLTPGECGQSALNTGIGAQKLFYAGQNSGSATIAAGSHLLFQSPAPLVAGAQRSAEGAGNNLYESIGGGVRLVSVLPGGESDANAVFGGLAGAPAQNHPNLSNVISQDGSRIFWTDLATGKLYERVNGTVTTPVSAGQAIYRGASEDGRLVFYTEAGTLWRFDTSDGSRTSIVGANAELLGIAGISQDGAYVYFAAQGGLVAGATKRICKRAIDELFEKQGTLTPAEAQQLEDEGNEETRGRMPEGRGCNLYVVHNGVTSLIATLSAHDDQIAFQKEEVVSSAVGVWQAEPGHAQLRSRMAGGSLSFSRPSS